MMFYPHRTVEEQMNRLPLDLQEKYKSSQIDRIYIDGELITGYFEYSFLEEKSYVEQPTRGSDGSIRDLNEYSTFLTPRIIIRYNMMNIEDYRKLMKKLKTKNAFVVECYDVVEDKRVSHEMYFATPSMPIIYQQYLMALGIKEYTIELIGTNNTQNYTVSYYYNFPEELKSLYIQDFGILEPRSLIVTGIPYNNRYIVGGLNAYIPNTDKNTSVSDWAEQRGYTLINWNTDDSGFGVGYTDNEAYFLSNNLTIYAQWVKQ